MIAQCSVYSDFSPTLNNNNNNEEEEEEDDDDDDDNYDDNLRINWTS